MKMATAASASTMTYTGYELLHDPRLNKGTAFTAAERRKYGLEGLLPATVSTIEVQAARRHAEITKLDDDLQKYLVLSDLQARNETLFYSVLMSDPAYYMPLVYTPTVGEACQKFGHIFRSPRGMHLPISARGPGARDTQTIGRKRTSGSSSSPMVNGSWDSGTSAPAAWASRSGNFALYTACAGVPPEILSADCSRCRHRQPSATARIRTIIGVRQPRVRGAGVFRVHRRVCRGRGVALSKCCIQWEDFTNRNAVPHSQPLPRQDLHV